ncbi:MAG: hypothetical protein RLY87_1758 [Chloroflexota bacterium]
MHMNTGFAILNRFPAPFLVLISVLSVQLGAALARGLFPVIGAAGTVLMRLTVAIICLVVLVRPNVWAVFRANPLVIFLFGCTIGLSTVFFYIAVSRIPLGVAIAVEFIGPLLVALWNSRRFIERVWVIVAAASIALLVPDIGTNLDGYGIAAALVAAVFWGAYIVLAPRVAAVANEFDGLIAALCVAWVLLLIPGILQGGIRLVAVDIMGQSIVMGVLAAVIPFSFDFQALKRLPARVYGVLVCSEPIVGALIGYVVLHEQLTLATIGAVVGVTIASLGATLTHKEESHE